MQQLWRIIRFTSQLRTHYLAISGFTILLAIMAQLQPLLTKGVIDTLSSGIGHGHPNVGRVAVFALLMFVTDFGQTLFSNIAGYIGDITSARAQQIMSQRYFEQLLRLPQQYYDRALSGTLINRMNRGINQITNYLQTVTNNFLQFVFSTIFTLGIVYYFSWQVGIMLTLVYPVYIYLTTRSSARWQEYQHVINDEQDRATGRFAEAIGQVKVVKSFLQEKRELRLFDQHYGKAVTTTYPQSRYWHQRDILRRTVLNLLFFAIFAYIFIETARGQYSIGTMVLLIQYAVQIRIPIYSISYIVDATQRALANTKDYFEVMDTEPALTDQPGAKPLKVSHGRIDFEAVRFGYEETTVLKDISRDSQADVF